MSELFDQLVELVNKPEYKAWGEFQEKYLVDGSILVTPEQYRVLLRGSVPADLFARPTLAGVPVVIIPNDDRAHKIGDRYAIVIGGRIYIFNPTNWQIVP